MLNQVMHPEAHIITMLIFVQKYKGLGKYHRQWSMPQTTHHPQKCLNPLPWPLCHTIRYRLFIFSSPMRIPTAHVRTPPAPTFQFPQLNNSYHLDHQYPLLQYPGLANPLKSLKISAKPNSPHKYLYQHSTPALNRIFVILRRKTWVS